MKHFYPSPDLNIIELEIDYGNPVKEMPVQRPLLNIQYEGIGFTGKIFTFKLAKMEMGSIRENFSKYRRDLPPFMGRMDLLQYWVESIWDALYNPVWMRWVRHEDFLEHPNPKKRGRVPNIEYQLLHGHHRIRIFNALNANHIWVYMCTGHHHGSDLPDWAKETRRMNTRAPVRGTRGTTCTNCGIGVSVSSKKYNDFNIKRWYRCKKCGHYDDTYQPYPERL